MKNITIVFSIALALIISLLSLAAHTKNPLIQAYSDTIKLLKEQHHSNTEIEILALYPELEHIREAIQKNIQLKFRIEQSLNATIPPLEPESKALHNAIQDLKQKRKIIHQQLAEIQNNALVQL